MIVPTGAMVNPYALPPCPRCGAESFESVSDGVDTNLRCRACGACWYLELGWFSRVNPVQCQGCPYRAECLSQWAADHGHEE